MKDPEPPHDDRNHEPILEELMEDEETMNRVLEEIEETDVNPVLLKHARHNLLRLYTSTLLLRSAFGTVMLLLPVYLHELGKTGGPQFSGVEIGLVVGSYFIGEMAFVTIFGRLSDLMQKRRPFIVVGNLVAAVSFAMFSLSNDFFVLFWAHVVEGVGAAMVIGPSLALIGDSTPVQERGTKMGLFETVTFGGMAVGFLLGGAVYKVLGGAAKYGHWSFAILSPLLLFGAYEAYKMIEPDQTTWEEEWHLLKRFYRETINHKINIFGGIIVASFVWLMSGVQMALRQSFDFYAMLRGEYLHARFVWTLYAAAIILVVTGVIDLYLELTLSTQDKTPLGGEEHSHIDEVIEAFKHEDLKRILPAWLMVMIIIGTITTYLPIILNQGVGTPGETSTPTDDSLAQGFNVLEIGVFFVLGMVVLGSMQYSFGKLVDHWGRKPVLTLGLVSLVIMSADVVYVVGFKREILQSPFSYPGILFVAIGGISALGVGAFGPAALAVLADSSDQSNRGMSGGIYSFLMGLGEITGDVVGGVFWDLGNEFLGPNGGAIMVLVFVLIMALGAFFSVHRLQDLFGAILRKQPNVEAKAVPSKDALVSD